MRLAVPPHPHTSWYAAHILRISVDISIERYLSTHKPIQHVQFATQRNTHENLAGQDWFAETSTGLQLHGNPCMLYQLARPETLLQKKKDTVCMKTQTQQRLGEINYPLFSRTRLLQPRWNIRLPSLKPSPMHLLFTPLMHGRKV
jgi:hypothetical protein